MLKDTLKFLFYYKRSHNLFLYLFIIFQSLLPFSMSKLHASHIYPDETAVAKYLKSCEVTEFDSGLDTIDCIYVINLDKRPEKWERMKSEFDKRNLKGNRFSGVLGTELSQEVREELFGPYPVLMRGGQLGCFLSHISILKDAYERGFDRIWILEDDAIFLENPVLIPHLLKKLTKIDPDWDLFYTDIDIRNDSGKHVRCHECYFRPDQEHLECNDYNHRTKITHHIMKSGLRWGMHSYLVSKKGIKKILDYYTHVYLWYPIDFDIHYIPGIKEYSSTRDMVTNWHESPTHDTLKDP